MIDLGAAIVLVLVATNLGRFLVRRIAGDGAFPAADLTLLGWGIGAAAIGLAAFALAALHILALPALLGLFIAALAVPLTEWPRFAEDVAALFAGSRRSDRIATACVLAGAAVVPLGIALCPPFAKDALVYHLAVPKLYLQAGGLRYVAGNIYANFPMGEEMLYLAPMALGLDRVPALIHLTYSLFASALVFRLAGRFTTSTLALVPAALFAWTPTVMVSAGWPYVDLAVVYAVLAFFVAWFRFRETGARRVLIAAGALAGSAFAAKYTGGFVVLLGGVLLLLHARRTKQKTGAAAGDLIVYGAAAAVLVVPWLVKNVAYTGNPLYPFAFGLFGGRDWDAYQAATFAEFLKNFGMGRAPLDLLLLPVHLAFNAEWEGRRFDGKIGVLPLAALIAFIALAIRTRSRDGIWRDSAWRDVVLSWLAYGVFWTFTTQQVRFFLPVLALFCVALAGVFPKADDGPGVRVAAWAAVAAIAIGGLVPTASALGGIKPWRYLVGEETKSEFLDRNYGLHPAIRYANANLPAEARVLLLQVGDRGYYLEREYYSDSVVEVAYLDRAIRASRTPIELRDRLVDDGFTHVLLNEKYVARPFSGRSLELLGSFFRGYTTSVYFSKPYRVIAIRTGD
jgi:hypothetical protein